MSKTKNQKKQKIYCNRCQLSTWHNLCSNFDIEQEEFVDGYTDEVYPSLFLEHQIWQCRGCEEVVFGATVIDNDGELLFEHYYPERKIKYLVPKEYEKIPDKINSLYTEVIKAFNDNCPILCAAGLRALIEGICNDKGITSGKNSSGRVVSTLEGKINGLTSIVPEPTVKNLHGLRFLGNKPLHTLEKPAKNRLELAITVIEHILNAVYELNYKSALLYKLITEKGISSTSTST